MSRYRLEPRTGVGVSHLRLSVHGLLLGDFRRVHQRHKRLDVGFVDIVEEFNNVGFGWLRVDVFCFFFVFLFFLYYLYHATHTRTACLFTKNSARYALCAPRRPACGGAGSDLGERLAGSLVNLPMRGLASAVTVSNSLAQ